MARRYRDDDMTDTARILKLIESSDEPISPAQIQDLWPSDLKPPALNTIRARCTDHRDDGKIRAVGGKVPLGLGKSGKERWEHQYIAGVDKAYLVTKAAEQKETKRRITELEKDVAELRQDQKGLRVLLLELDRDAETIRRALGPAVCLIEQMEAQHGVSYRGYGTPGPLNDAIAALDQAEPTQQ